MTDKISEFLTKFDDQHLANLQAAAEDGMLVYHNCERCLLGHFEGNYSFTKWEGEHATLAKEAELQYAALPAITLDDDRFCYSISIRADIERRKAMLPLIQAEWIRRAPVPVEEAELVAA